MQYGVDRAAGHHHPEQWQRTYGKARLAGLGPEGAWPSGYKVKETHPAAPPGAENSVQGPLPIKLKPTLWDSRPTQHPAIMPEPRQCQGQGPNGALHPIQGEG